MVITLVADCIPISSFTLLLGAFEIFTTGPICFAFFLPLRTFDAPVLLARRTVQPFAARTFPGTPLSRQRAGACATCPRERS
jgi:hypothetical protein